MTGLDKSTLGLAIDLDRLMRTLDCTARPRLRAIDPFGIGPFGAMVLMSIADVEPVSLQALGRQLARDKAQMTRTVNALEEHGLVEKHRDADDARVALATLTEDGRSLTSQFQEIIGETVTTMLGDLSETEQTQFAGLLAKIVAARADDALTSD